MSSRNEEFDRLIAYIHGELSDDECREFEEQLQQDRPLCRMYLELAEDELTLARRAASEEAARVLDEGVFGTKRDVSPRKSSRKISSAWWITIAACIVAACTTIWGIKERGMRQAQGPAQQEPLNEGTSPETPIDPNLTGHLVTDAAALFRTGFAPQDNRFERRRYVLDEGIAHVQLVSGVDLVLKAPVDFTISDPLHMQLDSGAVRATVPEKAKGFLVTTPTADVEDLGTEFGVSVNTETRESEVHVFDGEVNIREENKGDVTMLLHEGQAAQVDRNGASQTGVVRADLFPSADSVAVKRWRLWSEEFRKDPSLVAYYPFERISEPELLSNTATGSSAGDGTIKEAIWTTGRWPGKDALWFDNDSHSVELRIEGDYPSLTIAAWIKFDRFESGSSIILRSSNWNAPGALRFFTSRNSSLVNGSVGGAIESRPKALTRGIPTGEWLHLATVFDGEASEYRSYLNGNLMMTRKCEESVPIRIGNAKLAVSRDVVTNYNWKAIRGRIDELAIWNRVVPAEELTALVRETNAGP